MKIKKRFSAFLLCVISFVILLPTPVFSAVDNIKTDRSSVLNVIYKDGELPIKGARFDIYRIAELDGEGNIILDEEIRKYNVSIDTENAEKMQAAADTLKGYILRDSLKPVASGITDSEGSITFESLLCGLYLVMGSRFIQDSYIYDTKPFIVSLPVFDSEQNIWNYIVTVQPKGEKQPETSEPSTVTRKVLKVWNDEGNKKARPKNIEVELLCDGKVIDTVTLNAENNWRHTWTGLDAACEWTVTEKTVSGYTVETTLEGITFLVTNTVEKPESPAPKPSEPSTEPEPPDENLPVTGQLWWPVMLMICAGLLLTVVGLLLHRGDKREE